jgi:tetratricopeptide (TPR) repeat protein
MGWLIRSLRSLSIRFKQALLQRAKIHLKDCHLPLALADLNSLKAKSAFDSDAQTAFNEYLVANAEYDAAMNAYERKDFDSALEKFAVLLSVCSNSVDVRMKRADAYLQKEDYEMAIADLM